MRHLVVQKFGGTSVGTTEHIKKVADHIAATKRQNQQVVAIISAMGEQTDELLTLAKQISRKPPRRELDMLLTAGERISMALLSIALHERGVASVSLTGSQCGILTDETHGNARILRISGERIRSNLLEDRVVIVAGFQGVSPRTKEVTTLGRGGSDLSAVALASALQANSCQLYKDVHGVYTADPRIIKSARIIEELSWLQMSELAWSGAGVLHARAAHVAAKYQIPFEIRSSIDLSTSGTLIKGILPMESAKVAAIAHRDNMSLVEVRLTASPETRDFFATMNDWLWQQGEAPLISWQRQVKANELEIIQVTKDEEDYLSVLKETAQQLGATVTAANSTRNLATISIIGEGFSQSPEVLQKVKFILGSEPLLCDHSNTAIHILLDSKALEPSLKDLHFEFFEKG